MTLVSSHTGRTGSTPSSWAAAQLELTAESSSTSLLPDAFEALVYMQVEEVALAKHGSLEALESEKQRRMQGKLEQRMQKRQAAELEQERQQKREAQLQAVLKKYGSANADSAQDKIDGALGKLSHSTPAQLIAARLGTTAGSNCWEQLLAWGLAALVCLQASAPLK